MPYTPRPGTAPIPNKPGKTNWVEKAGGLPSYIRRIAEHLKGQGKSTSVAIATAVNTVKRWAAGGTVTAHGGPRVSAKTQAQAAAALASWNAKKAKSHSLSNRRADRMGGVTDASGVVDLAEGGAKWSHGWVPLNDAAKRIAAERGRKGDPRFRRYAGKKRPGGKEKPAAGGTHVVKKGDTLWALAARELGDGRRWKEIARANGVKNPRLLQIGTKLRIPGRTGSAGSGRGEPKGTTSMAPGERHPKGPAKVRKQRRTGRKKRAPRRVPTPRVAKGGVSTRVSMSNPGQFDSLGFDYVDLTPTSSWDTEARRKAASKGQAMPGGRFPIKDKRDVQKAIRALGRAKGSHAAVKRHIMARARALGASNLIPDSWKSQQSSDLANSEFDTIDLAGRWKHGWIPLDAVAALEKAKGNRARASKLLGSGAPDLTPSQGPGKLRGMDTPNAPRAIVTPTGKNAGPAYTVPYRRNPGLRADQPGGDARATYRAQDSARRAKRASGRAGNPEVQGRIDYRPKKRYPGADPARPGDVTTVEPEVLARYVDKKEPWALAEDRRRRAKDRKLMQRLTAADRRAGNRDAERYHRGRYVGAKARGVLKMRLEELRKRRSERTGQSGGATWETLEYKGGPVAVDPKTLSDAELRKRLTRRAEMSPSRRQAMIDEWSRRGVSSQPIQAVGRRDPKAERAREQARQAARAPKPRTEREPAAQSLQSMSMERLQNRLRGATGQEAADIIAEITRRHQAAQGATASNDLKTRLSKMSTRSLQDLARHGDSKQSALARQILRERQAK